MENLRRKMHSKRRKKKQGPPNRHVQAAKRQKNSENSDIIDTSLDGEKLNVNDIKKGLDRSATFLT